MKKILILFLLFNLRSFGQNIQRHYEDNFGNHLTLNNDSTFITKWCFDITVYWQTGDWKMNNDTLYFFPRQVFDTLYCDNKDSIILSVDTKPSRIPCDQSPSLMGYSNWQRDSLIPKLLVFKADRLYELKADGKLLKKAPGKRRKISIRNDRLDKPPIILLSWQTQIPAYYTCRPEK